MGEKMRLQVVVGGDRLIVPIPDNENPTVGWLLAEAQRRANTKGATHVLLPNGFSLFLDDKIRDVVESNETLTVCNRGKLADTETPKELPVSEPPLDGPTHPAFTISRNPSTSIPTGHNRHPFRILLVRHGLSAANLDPSVYEHTPEHRIQLSSEGKTMARNAGHAIARYFLEVFGTPAQAGKIRLWYSPYVRTFQTAMCIRDSCGAWISDAMEHPMIAELDYGLFEGRGRSYAAELGLQKELKHYNMRARHSGRFWARFPMGESPFDVCARMQLFFGTLNRDREEGRKAPVDTVILVTHGIALRCFVKMWCHYSHDWYEQEWNPNNCAVRLITQTSGDEGYIFNGYDSEDSNNEAQSPFSNAQNSCHTKTGTPLGQMPATRQSSISTNSNPNPCAATTTSSVSLQRRRSKDIREAREAARNQEHQSEEADSEPDSLSAGSGVTPTPLPKAMMPGNLGHSGPGEEKERTPLGEFAATIDECHAVAVPHPRSPLSPAPIRTCDTLRPPTPTSEMCVPDSDVEYGDRLRGQHPHTLQH